MASNILFLLVVMPVYVLGNIHVEIRASKDRERASVQYFGEDVSPISGAERQTFKIYENNLKHAVKNYFGRWPNDVYVNDNNRWRLYDTYGWEQVQRVLTPTAARVLSINTNPVIMTTKYLVNHHNKTAIYKADISHSVETRTSTMWTTGGELSVGTEISVGVSFAVAHASATTRINYSTSWGKISEISKATTVSTSSGIEVELGPGEVAHVEMSATEGTMEVEVEYTATLRGEVAVNYHRRYKGHHFWSLGLPCLQNAIDAPTSVNSKAIMTVGFYSDAQIVLRN